MNDLLPTIQMTNEFCDVLAEIERNGMKVAVDRLDRLESQFRKRHAKLKIELDRMLGRIMGDTPINIGSPEQLSKVVFSRALISKQRWALEFGLEPNQKPAHRAYNLGRVKPYQYAYAVKSCTTPMYKTKAYQCKTCKGTGRVQTYNKDGSASKRLRVCNSNLKKVKQFRFAQVCGGVGYKLVDTTDIAGLGLMPRCKDVTASGWKTDKFVLEHLLVKAKGTPKVFLETLLEYNAIDSKLTNLIPGIRKGMIGDMLHTTFNQAVAATGRLSSKNPNVQNFPRGTTFPIKEIFVSRWAGGKILDSDYSGLEFVAAVELSHDAKGTEDILNKQDKHTYTAEYLRARGQRMSRTTAKIHTFKPLYGGSSGTKAEQAYYLHFYDLHPGIKVWHRELIEEVLTTKQITLPTGRHYSFPQVIRTAKGCTFETQVKNYPVQGFATADIVPCAVIAVHRALKDYKSLIINTVHDSIILDIHPSELDIVPELVYDTMIGVHKELKRRYDYTMTLPLRCELSMGANWFSGVTLTSSKFNKED